MDILQKIVAHKKVEVEARKLLKSSKSLEKESPFDRVPLSLKDRLMEQDSTGIIAEFKRQSPSKGMINDHARIDHVTAAYASDASGISVLTDSQFFGGSLDDLTAARFNQVPLLRKDFMVDEYQVIEAKAYGADVILLIAACLSKKEVKKMARLSKSLGMEVLLEVHDASELGHIADEVDLVGVNNRNLKTFEVDIHTSLELIHLIPDSKPAIAESGITDVQTIVSLKQAGFKGFLIGENFMRHADPAIAFADFIHQLKAIQLSDSGEAGRNYEN